MLNSYSNNTGIETKIWLKISGGVIIADKINISTIACFLYFLIISGVISPILERKYAKIGNSKRRPFAKEIAVTIEIMLVNSIINWSCSLIEYEAKKLIESGETK